MQPQRIFGTPALIGFSRVLTLALPLALKRSKTHLKMIIWRQMHGFGDRFISNKIHAGCSKLKWIILATCIKYYLKIPKIEFIPQRGPQILVFKLVLFGVLDSGKHPVKSSKRPHIWRCLRWIWRSIFLCFLHPVKIVVIFQYSLKLNS